MAIRKICTELDINFGVVSFEGDLNLQEVPYGEDKKALIGKGVMDSVSLLCMDHPIGCHMATYLR